MRIKAGIVGMGYIGVSHIEAIRRIGFAGVEAVTDTNNELAERKAEEFGISKCYTDVEAMLADDSIDVVHNCTPNHLHAEINEKIIRAGKHVLSEKPLTRTSSEAEHITRLLEESPGIKGCVNFNYRMNPLVQEIKTKIAKGEIGKPYLVHGSYLQDWLLYDTDYNWRIEPEVNGPSRCIADIGSHWMDAVQTVLDTKIIEVCSDLVTVHPVRKKPLSQVETFSRSKAVDHEEKEVKTEDYGAVLFKMENGVHGVFYVSEVSAGRGCRLDFEIDGSKASLYWNQEQCDQMWMGFRDDDNRQIMRDPNKMSPGTGSYTYLAKGHPEGWNDAFRNNISSFYRHLVDEAAPRDYATFRDALYIIKLTEAILESSKAGKWIKIGGSK